MQQMVDSYKDGHPYHTIQNTWQNTCPKLQPVAQCPKADNVSTSNTCFSSYQDHLQGAQTVDRTLVLPPSMFARQFQTK